MQICSRKIGLPSNPRARICSLSPENCSLLRPSPSQNEKLNSLSPGKWRAQARECGDHVHDSVFAVCFRPGLRSAWLPDALGDQHATPANHPHQQARWHSRPRRFPPVIVTAAAHARCDEITRRPACAWSRQVIHKLRLIENKARQASTFKSCGDQIPAELSGIQTQHVEMTPGFSAILLTAEHALGSSCNEARLAHSSPPLLPPEPQAETLARFWSAIPHKFQPTFYIVGPAARKGIVDARFLMRNASCMERRARHRDL
ncbi:uncharacterized protein VTP21DRAFT_4447 [Calcarisporiella thermophila]|uniref:uncharacterized protein n=1 Tax=Calcarisporiella thermophila TaxID=911321 RepID=UPI003743EC63